MAEFALDASDSDLTAEHLQLSISTMPEWSTKQPWTKAQMAAWRLHWFGRTPEQDQTEREDSLIARFDRERRGDYDRPAEREPFIDWPNGQGTYD